ncbi:MAG: hypothetical protein O7C59_07535 [Rickettsia endosymbiont of Ixodes persulcatus]|nr:hypothetical protein [Rickettsia endosymbiont of Ixodes persulcatus]
MIDAAEIREVMHTTIVTDVVMYASMVASMSVTDARTHVSMDAMVQPW